MCRKKVRKRIKRMKASDDSSDDAVEGKKEEVNTRKKIRNVSRELNHIEIYNNKKFIYRFGIGTNSQTQPKPPKKRKRNVKNVSLTDKNW